MKYDVLVRKVFLKQVTVEAESKTDAESLVRDMLFDDNSLSLGEEDLVEVDIEGSVCY